jgi:branched-subunit amino acid ABC-type transport system permease component
VDTLLQQLVNGLSLGSIYALIALGYTMVYGKRPVWPWGIRVADGD